MMPTSRKNAERLKLEAQIQDLCYNLCKHGVESFLVSICIRDDSTSYKGSQHGRNFLLANDSIAKTFIRFCKDAVQHNMPEKNTSETHNVPENNSSQTGNLSETNSFQTPAETGMLKMSISPGPFCSILDETWSEADEGDDAGYDEVNDDWIDDSCDDKAHVQEAIQNILDSEIGKTDRNLDMPLQLAEKDTMLPDVYVDEDNHALQQGSFVVYEDEKSGKTTLTHVKNVAEIEEIKEKHSVKLTVAVNNPLKEDRKQKRKIYRYCKNCDLDFPTEYQYRKHKRLRTCTESDESRKDGLMDDEKSMNTTDFLWQCLDCDMIFSSQLQLEQHKVLVCKKMKPKWNEVMRDLETKSQVKKNLILSDNSKLVSGSEGKSLTFQNAQNSKGQTFCPRCKTDFRKDNTLKEHLKVCTTGFPVKKTCRNYWNSKWKQRRKASWEHCRKYRYCLKCRKFFNSYSQLMWHKKLKCYGVFECSFCDDVFENRSARDEHAKVHDSKLTEGFTVVRLEGTDFIDEMRKLIVRDGKKLYCKACDEGLCKVSATQHIIGWHSSLFRCGICHQVVQSLSAVRKHRQQHQSGNVRTMPSYSSSKCAHVCVYCGKIYSRRKCLERHVISHHMNGEANRFMCTICAKYFRDVADLRRHIGLHKVQYRCERELCDAEFVSKTELLMHIKECHPLHYLCSFCGKVFKYRSGLYTHVQTHLEDRPHVCAVCGASFKTKDVYSRHVRIHSSIKRYICEVCGRGFNQTGGLQKHMSIHSNLRPWKCQICGVDFKKKISLDTHKLNTNHFPAGEDLSGVRYHECNICQKKFVSRSEKGLKRHTRVHSGEKPYPCQFCDRKFGDKSNLKHHEMLHLGTKPYKCERCGKKFTKRRSLRKHALSIHKIILQDVGSDDEDENEVIRDELSCQDLSSKVHGRSEVERGGSAFENLSVKVHGNVYVGNAMDSSETGVHRPALQSRESEVQMAVHSRVFEDIAAANMLINRIEGASGHQLDSYTLMSGHGQ